MTHGMHADHANLPAPSDDLVDQASEKKVVRAPTAEQFSLFASSVDGSTLLQFGNKLHDSFLPKDFQPSEQDAKELADLLADHSNDNMFNDIINLFFRSDVSAYTIKQSIASTTEFPHISIHAAHNVLNTIYDATESNTIRSYILFLTVSIGDYFEALCHKANSLEIPNELFNRFADEFIEQYKAKAKNADKRKLNPYVDGYSLLGFICQHDDSNHLTQKQYMNVKFESNLCKSFGELQKQIERNHAALNPLRLRGFNVGNSFDNAVRIFSFIQHSWDKLSATFALRNKALPMSLSGGGLNSQMADSDVVQIYSGNYSLVPTSEPTTQRNNVDVIADFDSFNQLSQQRQLQVTHFLESNRKRFNNILAASTQIVMGNLKSKLNQSAIRSRLQANRYTPISVRQYGVSNDNNADSDLATFASALDDSYKASTIKTFDQAIGFIVHSYIPMLNHFNNKITSKYGASEATNIMNRLSVDNHLCIFGAARNVSLTSLSLAGGARHAPEIKYIEKRVEVPVERRVEVPVERRVEVPVERRVEVVKHVEKFRGGTTSTEDYITALINGQKAFNKAYENLYRKLYQAISSISSVDAESGNTSRIYAISEMLNDIGIKSSYTTSYISGYFGAYDYNKIYSNAVNKTIEYIKSTSRNEFNDVISILNDIINLLSESYSNVQALRTRFISAPKTVSETLHASLKSIKQPCGLTDSDFTAYNDACMRLKLIISNSGIDRNQLKKNAESYMLSMDSRINNINEHYDNRIAYIREQHVASAQYDNTYRDVRIAIENILRDGMIYLNKVLDAKLSSESARKTLSNISKEDLENIHKAYLSFSSSTIQIKLKETFDDINDDLKNQTVSYIYKCVKHLKKLLRQSRYISYIAQLYRELHIFSGDFNWQEFEDKLTNIIVYSSIGLSKTIKVDNTSYSISALRHAVCKAFEDDFAKKTIKIDASSTLYQFFKPDNAAYIMLYEVLETINTSESTDTKGTVFSVLFGQDYERFKDEIGCGGLNKNDTYASKFKEYYTKRGFMDTDPTLFAPEDTHEKWYVTKLAAAPSELYASYLRNDDKLREACPSGKIKNDGFEFANTDNMLISDIFPYMFENLVEHTTDNSIKVKKASNPEALDSIRLFKSTLSTNMANVNKFPIYISLFNTAFDGKFAVGTLGLVKALFVYIKLMMKHGEAIKNGSGNVLPYYITHLNVYLGALQQLFNDPGSKMQKLLGASCDISNDCSISFIKPRYEMSLVKMTLEALMTNIIGNIDDIWSVKYTGSGGLPLNISSVLTGGDIQRGGSYFDIQSLSLDTSGSEIIPEATPFYVCAFHILMHYFTNFNDDRTKLKDTKGHGMFLEVSKVSQLYPVYNIFHKNKNVNGKNVDIYQLQIIVSVLNKYWEQTSGEPSRKLSSAIDLLLNELNANFIFTDKIQLDMIKSSNVVTRATVDLINERAELMVEAMQRYLNAAIIDTSIPRESQVAQLEQLLNASYTKIKNEPARSRMGILKSFLNDEDNTTNSLEDFYKFMELVVSPILVCNTAYSNIFRLFDYDTYNISSDENKILSIDFSKIDMFYKDAFVDVPKDAGNKSNDVVVECKSNAWDVISAVRENKRPELKALFIENPMVLRYNKIQLAQALSEMHESKHFRMPDFWIVMDENTYPKSAKVTFTSLDRISKPHNVILIKQLWPNVKGNNLGVYFRQCLHDYANDCKHYISNFLAYPGLSDRARHIIAELVKNTMSEDNILSMNEPRTDDGRINDSLYSAFDTVPIKEFTYYIYPPDYPHEFKLVSFYNGQTLAEPLLLTGNSRTFAELTDKHATDEDKQNIYIDGTTTYIDMLTQGRVGLFHKCNYTWLDWVIFNIACCDKVNNCVPYKLILMMLDSTVLATSLREPPTEVKTRHLLYNYASAAMLDNVVTQNIVARSMSLLNKDRLEYTKLNSSWIAALISVTPYLISTLQANGQSINSSVTYNGTNVLSMINALVEILTAFYNDISAYMPFIPFMSSGIQFTNDTQIRPIGSIVGFIKKYNVSNMTVNEYIQLEWANKWFFSGFDSIAFPEYKNKNRFEWINKFAASTINNSVFSNSFNTTLEVLGRNVWSSVIAKSCDISNNTLSLEYQDIDKIVIKTINYMCECDTLIIEKFVNNVIDQYYDNVAKRVVETKTVNPSRLVMFGGNQSNVPVAYSIATDDYKIFINSLVAGIIPENAINFSASSLGVDRRDEEIKRQIKIDERLRDDKVNLINIDACPRFIQDGLANKSTDGSINAMDMIDLHGHDRYEYLKNNLKSLSAVWSIRFDDIMTTTPTDKMLAAKAKLKEQLNKLDDQYRRAITNIADITHKPNSSSLDAVTNFCTVNYPPLNPQGLSVNTIDQAALLSSFNNYSPVPYYYSSFEDNIRAVTDNVLSQYGYIRLLPAPYAIATKDVTTATTSTKIFEAVKEVLIDYVEFKACMLANNDGLTGKKSDDIVRTADVYGRDLSNIEGSASNVDTRLHTINVTETAFFLTDCFADGVSFVKSGEAGVIDFGIVDKPAWISGDVKMYLPFICSAVKHCAAYNSARTIKTSTIEFVSSAFVLNSALCSIEECNSNKHAVGLAHLRQAVVTFLCASELTRNGVFIHYTNTNHSTYITENNKMDYNVYGSMIQSKASVLSGDLKNAVQAANVAANFDDDTSSLLYCWGLADYKMKLSDKIDTSTGTVTGSYSETKRFKASGIDTAEGLLSFMIDNCYDLNDNKFYKLKCDNTDTDINKEIPANMNSVGSHKLLPGEHMFRGSEFDEITTKIIDDLLISDANLDDPKFYARIVLPLVSCIRTESDDVTKEGWIKDSLDKKNGSKLWNKKIDSTTGFDTKINDIGNTGNDDSLSPLFQLMLDFYRSELSECDHIGYLVTNDGKMNGVFASADVPEDNLDILGELGMHLFKPLFEEESFKIMYNRLMHLFLLYVVSKWSGLPGLEYGTRNDSDLYTCYAQNKSTVTKYEDDFKSTNAIQLLHTGYVNAARNIIRDCDIDDGTNCKRGCKKNDTKLPDGGADDTLCVFKTHVNNGESTYPLKPHGVCMLEAYRLVMDKISNYIDDWFKVPNSPVLSILASTLQLRINDIIVDDIITTKFNPTTLPDLYELSVTPNLSGYVPYLNARLSAFIGVCNGVFAENKLGYVDFGGRGALDSEEALKFRSKTHVTGAKYRKLYKTKVSGVDALCNGATKSGASHMIGRSNSTPKETFNSKKLFRSEDIVIKYAEQVITELYTIKESALDKFTKFFASFINNDGIITAIKSWDTTKPNMFYDILNKYKDTLYENIIRYNNDAYDYIYKLSNLAASHYVAISGISCVNVADLKRGLLPRPFVGGTDLWPKSDNNSPYITNMFVDYCATTEKLIDPSKFNQASNIVKTNELTKRYYILLTRMYAYTLQTYMNKYMIIAGNSVKKSGDISVFNDLYNKTYAQIYRQILDWLTDLKFDEQAPLYCHEYEHLRSKIDSRRYAGVSSEIIRKCIQKLSSLVYYPTKEAKFYNLISLQLVLDTIWKKVKKIEACDGDIKCFKFSDDGQSLNAVSYLEIATVYRQILALFAAFSEDAKNKGIDDTTYNGAWTLLKGTTDVEQTIDKSAISSLTWDPLSKCFDELTKKAMTLLDDVDAIALNRITGGSFGLYNETKESIVYSVAAGIALCVKNRSVYIDENQNLGSYPIIVTVSNDDKINAVDTNLCYLYKYMYNPKLITSSNQTPLTDYEFITRVCAKKNLYILDPLDISLGDTVYNVFEPNETKAEPKLDEHYNELLAKHGIPIMGTLENPTVVMLSNGKSLFARFKKNESEIKRIFDIQNDLMLNKHNFVASDKTSSPAFVDVNGETKVAGKLEDINNKYTANDYWLYKDSAATAKVPFHAYKGDSSIINKELTNVCYISNDSFMKPVQHNVTISDKMFLYLPWTPIVTQHLFSPQKDIYNVTLIEPNQLASPTVLKPFYISATSKVPWTDQCLMQQYFRNVTNYKHVVCEGYDSNDNSFKTIDDMSIKYNHEPVTSLSKFITKLINTSVGNMFNYNFDPKHFNNSGFTLSSVDDPAYADSTNDDVVNSITVYDSNEHNVLAQLYQYRSKQDTIDGKSRGYALYSTLFKNRSHVKNENYMFAVIMNYFNKRVLSFNGMFDNLCFPSIVYGSSVFRFALNELSNMKESIRMNDIANNASSYTESIVNLIMYYIKHITNNNQSISNHTTLMNQAYEYYHQINVSRSTRSRMSISDVTSHINVPDSTVSRYSHDDIPSDNINVYRYPFLWLANQYSTLSTNNGFFDTFVNQTRPTEKGELGQLFTSGISGMIRYLDSSTTFLNVLMLLLQNTSHYSIDNDADISLISNSKPEPFSA